MAMVRTRFAPSPTGYLHIGGFRTATYAYALAKHAGGEFLLRIEDTDQKRQIPGAVEKICSILKTFSLNWDGNIVVQSQRAASGVYRQAALKLVASGHAFYSQAQPKDFKQTSYSTQLRDPDRDRNLASGAIKLKIPDNETISFYDFVLNKTVSWHSSKVPDVVLLKSDGSLPTYHLAQAVDDHDSEVTHVIRSSEWIPSTPIHILVHKYLGYELPQIGHPTAILDPAGGKLSKRKGNVSVEQFLSEGYLPEALLNFVILLGWAPKDNRELFTLSDFVTAIEINGFQKSNPILNLTKLNWFNGHYLRSKTITELTQLVKPYMKTTISDNQIAQILILVKDRMVKLSDIVSLSSFFFTRPRVEKTLFSDSSQSSDHLKFALQNLNSLDDSIVPTIKERGWKVGDFFMTLRIAICGSRFTPPLAETIKYLGLKEVSGRLSDSLHLLST